MSGRETAFLRHASAVEIDGKGVLIVGSSGSGKSSLAIDLISRGATLIADDQTEVLPGRPPRLSPPTPTEGLIELRGVGLYRLPFRSNVPAELIVDLDQEAPERLPPLAVSDLMEHPIKAISGKGLINPAAAVIISLRGARLDPDSELQSTLHED